MKTVMLAVVAVVAAFLSVLLRKQRPEQAMAVGLIAGIGMLLLVLTEIIPVLQSLSGLFERAALPSEYGSLLFKGLGVCFVTQMAADTCRDAGESALASKAELVGKVSLLILSLPLFEKIAELTVGLINGKMP